MSRCGSDNIVRISQPEKFVTQTVKTRNNKSDFDEKLDIVSKLLECICDKHNLPSIGPSQTPTNESKIKFLPRPQASVDVTAHLISIILPKNPINESKIKDRPSQQSIMALYLP